MTKSLEEMTKDEVADIAAAIFSFQHMGATTLVKLADTHPWLVERAPCRWEMEAILDLARRGKMVDEADEAYFDLCAKLRHRYHFDTQLALWESGKSCFPVVVYAALSELHEYTKVMEQLALAFGTSAATVRRWELGLSAPHPDIQQKVVQALREAVLDQRERTWPE